MFHFGLCEFSLKEDLDREEGTARSGPVPCPVLDHCWTVKVRLLMGGIPVICRQNSLESSLVPQPNTAVDGNEVDDVMSFLKNEKMMKVMRFKCLDRVINNKTEG